MRKTSKNVSPDLRKLAEACGVADIGAIDLASLGTLTRRELLRAAHLVGLGGVSRLRKDSLVAALRDALRELQSTTPAAQERARQDVRREKFAAVRREPTPTEQIPWSYGHDRVRAMAVDPERLYVYWEVTDPAIAKARSGLGPGGGSAWLNLRLYDTTGRLFDGTNAHAYLDHKVERHDRQWFFRWGKPASEAVVELGMLSDEGYFVRIARSGKVAFPRQEPALANATEWMTVRLAAGSVEALPAVAPPGQRYAAGPTQLPLRVEPEHERPPWVQPGVSWWESLPDSGTVEMRSYEWEGPLEESSWQTGPLTYPLEAGEPVCERLEGGVHIERRDGRTRVIYGPWQVLVRGLAAFARRSILARWEVFRSWIVEEGTERTLVGPWRDPSMIGASEASGASERRFRGASRMWWRGASELSFLGASERRWRGASERLYAAASQWLFRGASERRFVGASERRFRGGSEKRLLGGSEQRLGGASERRRLGGASERRLGGASERATAGFPAPPKV
jgi:hypothetical protein